MKTATLTKRERRVALLKADDAFRAAHGGSLAGYIAYYAREGRSVEDATALWHADQAFRATIIANLGRR